MRHLFLALMIVLLPLRGWIGDVMAIEMVTGAAIHLQNANNTVNDNIYQADADRATPDCAGHSADDTSGLDTHCSTCTVCQVCHTVALLPVTAHSAAGLSPPMLPYSPAASFSSAFVALGQKPPIS